MRASRGPAHAPDVDSVERQAILLAWAEMRQAALADPVKATVIARARVLYLEDPDPGVHSAAELLLRRWGEPEILARLQAELQNSASSNSGLRWTVGPNEHTFAMLAGSLEFQMGAPEGKGHFYGSPNLHYRKIDRSIAVATKEVTVEQFKHFKGTHQNDPRYGDGPECAAIHISWFDAAAYCNWLSKTSGDSRKPNGAIPRSPGPGMVLSEDSVKRTGYRMPTEAEWEYSAERARRHRDRSANHSEFLSRYAWTWLNSDNQIRPVGQLMPNELGLFDVLGNAWEWCQDGPPGYYRTGERISPPTRPGRRRARPPTPLAPKRSTRSTALTRPGESCAAVPFLMLRIGRSRPSVTGSLRPIT